MSDDIRALQEKIKTARKFALKHFNAKDAKRGNMFAVDGGDIQILPPTFYVRFTDADKMEVTPSFMGRPSVVTFSYRLAFLPDGGTEWRGKNPLTGQPFPALKVEVA